MTVYTEKWNGVIGGSSGWQALFGTEINTTIANTNSILSSVAIANGTNADIFFDISYIAGGTVTTTAAGYLGFYLLPLLSDSLTYGRDEPFSIPIPADIAVLPRHNLNKLTIILSRIRWQCHNYIDYQTINKLAYSTPC